MAGYFVLGALAAFGVLCVFWALFGWLLPGTKGWVLACYGLPGEEMLPRIRWLRGLGLLQCPVLVVTGEDTAPDADLEICSGEELLPRLEWERNRFNGTGNGDYPGHHQRRGISEL